MKSFVFLLVFAAGVQASAQSFADDPNIQDRIEQHIIRPGPGDLILPTPSYSCFAEDRRVRYKAFGWNRGQACAEAVKFCRQQSRQPKSCRLLRR